MSRLASPLGRVVESAANADEDARTVLELERKAYHDAGLVVIGLDDHRVPQTLRDMVEAVARTRFGRRPQQQKGA